MRLLISWFVAVIWALPAVGQYKMQTAAGEAPGPWLLGTIGVGKDQEGKPITTALKGLAIKLGENGEAGICYDLDLCRVAGVWTGGKFVTPMNLMSRGEYSTAMGEVFYTTGEVAGFQLLPVHREREPLPKQIFKDSRPEQFGPIDGVRFKGFYENGSNVVLKWDVGGVEILEMPVYSCTGGTMTFERRFEIAASQSDLWIAIGKGDFEPGPIACVGTVSGTDRFRYEMNWRYPNFSWMCGNSLIEEIKKLNGDASKAGRRQELIKELESKATAENLGNTRFLDAMVAKAIDGLWLKVPPAKVAARYVMKLMFQAPSSAAEKTEEPDFDFKSLISGAPIRWGGRAGFESKVSNDSASAYVVDSVELPDPNPWGAPMFVSGFDFFGDGRAAVCTFHGDVFLVAGLEGDLKKVTWSRFASGLYHPLGLKVANGQIYVTCRDGLWRLNDLNADGEADFYEPFNFDLKVTKSFHEFVFDLQTDPVGNFYFAKAGPVKNGGRGFDEIMSQHGTLMRVSADGQKLEVVATGFRAPNGIGVGPKGELTSGDNEGTWTPACKINWIKPGGFYGVMDLVHRSPLPKDYDRPLCWLPKRADNSSGSQVWVPDDDRWGPWRGHLLHLSYGHASLFGVMHEEVASGNGSVVQGGVVQFPLKFQSGIMRARFNPKDGQLWVAGLRGWQTDGIKNGCLQRVRYTGAPVRMPIELHAQKDGVEIRFACSLDTQAAADPENWSVEAWNYIWSSAYGSPEVSTQTASDEKPAEAGANGVRQFTKAQLAGQQHDSLRVKSATIGTDDRSVFLEIDGMKPVMQMSIRYALRSSDGKDLKGEVINTVNALGEP